MELRIYFKVQVLIWFSQICYGEMTCEQVFQESGKQIYFTKFQDWREKVLRLFSPEAFMQEDFPGGFPDEIFYYNYLVRKHKNDISKIKNAFDVKMRIVGGYDKIDDTIAIETQNLVAFGKRRIDLYYSISIWFDKAFKNTFVYNEYDLKRSPDKPCGPCNNITAYKNCLDEVTKDIKKQFDIYESQFPEKLDLVERLEKVKGWHFVRNARVAAREKFDALKRNITVQQLRDYYSPKIRDLIFNINGRREGSYRFSQTEYLLLGGEILVRPLQYIYNLTSKLPRDSNCDYVTLIGNLIEVINERILPFTPVEFIFDEVVNKYNRPFENVTNIDYLIDIFEDTIKSIRLDFFGPPRNLFNVNTEANSFSEEINASLRKLYDFARKGYCPGINVLKQAGSGVYEVFDCFIKALKTKGMPTDNYFIWASDLGRTTRYHDEPVLEEICNCQQIYKTEIGRCKLSPNTTKIEYE
uniref:Uncharacterized protein n=1 Tax=Clastoptera arizonana TaxID=38151 RepID=A0A1B6CEC2_9HEMI